MDKAIEIIKHFEGLHDGDLKRIGLQPKMCPALIWTKGYGHAMSDPRNGKLLIGPEAKERAYELAASITEEQADQLLLEDYNRFELIVKSLVKQYAKPNELGAMVSLAFNIGQGHFKESAVLRFFNKGDRATSVESFKSWTKCNGKVLKGLQRRRQAEMHLFLYDEVKFE